MARRLTLLVRIDEGVAPVHQCRYEATIDAAEAFGFVQVLKSMADRWRTLHDSQELEDIRVLAIRSKDRTISARLAEQNTAGVPIRRHGLLLLFNGLLCARPLTNVKLLNSTGELAQVDGTFAGD